MRYKNFIGIGLVGLLIATFAWLGFPAPSRFFSAIQPPTSSKVEQYVLAGSRSDKAVMQMACANPKVSMTRTSFEIVRSQCDAIPTRKTYSTVLFRCQTLIQFDDPKKVSGGTSDGRAGYNTMLAKNRWDDELDFRGFCYDCKRYDNCEE